MKIGMKVASTRDIIERLQEYERHAAGNLECIEEIIQMKEYITDLYKTYYMQDHLNEEFDGIISGVQPYGFYVELDNTVEGLVKVENLPEDAYLYYEKTFKLKGQGHCYGLGDKVRVKAVMANLAERKIEFVLA